MARKWNISFKETSKDMKLWLAIQELEEKSFTVKDILYKALVEKRKFEKSEEDN